MKKYTIFCLMALLLVVFFGCENKKGIEYPNASFEVVNTTNYRSDVYIDTKMYLSVPPRSTDKCYFNSDWRLGGVLVGKPLYMEIYLINSNGKTVNVFYKDNFTMKAGEDWKITVKDDNVSSIKL